MKRYTSALALLMSTAVPGCNPGVGPGAAGAPRVEASGTIGPSGGSVEVTDPCSPSYGVKVTIPEGAVEQDVTISVSALAQADIEQELGPLSGSTTFVAGLRIDASGASLAGPGTVTIPAPTGITPERQLLVGKLEHEPGAAGGQLAYQGVAHIGSPISFTVGTFGAFAVLSPPDPRVVVSGSFLDQGGTAIAGGLVASSHSQPFIALASPGGQFELPAGPAGASVTMMGIAPNQPPAAGDLGLMGTQLPPPPVLLPPTSLSRAIVRGVIETLDIPDPPPECHCDPCRAAPVFTSPEDPEPPFELDVGQSIHPYLFGSAGVVSPSLSPAATFAVDVVSALWSGALCVTSAVLWMQDPSVAQFDAADGTLTGLREGTTTLHASVIQACQQLCPGGLTIRCVCPFSAAASVCVGDPWSSQAQLIVHFHNPEGVEISSIDRGGGAGGFGLSLFDGEVVLINGSWTPHQPIDVNAGAHTLRIIFNGMEKEEQILLAPGEKKTITFVFERTEWDISAWIDSLSPLTGSVPPSGCEFGGYQVLASGVRVQPFAVLAAGSGGSWPVCR